MSAINPESDAEILRRPVARRSTAQAVAYFTWRFLVVVLAVGLGIIIANIIGILAGWILLDIC